MWAGVPEYQTGLGTGLGKWKSHLQLSWGPGEPGLWRALPAPPLELLSCNLRVVHASRSCLRELAPLRQGWATGDQMGRWGSDPKSNRPFRLPPLPKLFLGACLSTSTQACLWQTWPSSLTPLSSPFAPYMQLAQHQRQEIQNPC